MNNEQSLLSSITGPQDEDISLKIEQQKMAMAEKSKKREDDNKLKTQMRNDKNQKKKEDKKNKREAKQTERLNKKLEKINAKQELLQQKKDKRDKIKQSQIAKALTKKTKVSKLIQNESQTNIQIKKNKTISFDKLDNKKASGKTTIKKGDKTIELSLDNNKIDGDIMIDKKSKKLFIKKHPKEEEPQVIIEKYNKANELIQITEVHRFINNKPEGKITVKNVKKNQETHSYAVNGVISGGVAHNNEKGSITCNVINSKKQGEATLFQNRNQKMTKLRFKDDKIVDKIIMKTPNTTQSYSTSKDGKIKHPKLFYLKLPWLFIQTIFNMTKRLLIYIIKTTFYLLLWIVTLPYKLIRLII